ncbi:hypothetical protein H103_08993 [Trichophyton rubrum CBS 288.86]|uniref:Xylanolytic transcriptional activator regulatory domain-containing protein n=1 Tax=Trichophyton rubrum CBS 288.86 TaxID=1215330 RepID=A0A022VML7_TRIRU|nr:hypothetical protein H100_09012 [Trichophyton rubrum MR850]EZF36533.1 hypothetical protein H102_08970 [Trichophyton rubrum CBS 100081]EZF47211.1 hypothetical protein H103_08993 [Trichophyton rubrum CBS 288.86]EZF57893.1 hypothetical protein H104_08941 [Trichophyton rubrum CBS 289.86]EZF79183.1 hypothetical protein H110_08993 [Trichophyton rubrum MR1448]EZG11380.1 hypothetical protein H107_09150 [Trichophyton rubrum CBS 202.88]
MERASTARPLRRRRRPTLACEPCRRKKVRRKAVKLIASRCDRNLPCEQCSRSKMELCNYLTDNDSLTTGFSNSRATSHITPPRPPGTLYQISIVNTLDTRLAAAEPTRGLSLPGFNASDRVPAHLLHVKDPVITPDIGKPPSSDTDSLSAPKAINIAAASPSAAYKENTVVRGIFSKTKFFGLSHWMNSIYQFPQVYDMLQKCELDETSEARAVYDKCKHLARAIKAQEIAKHNPVANILDHVPPRNVAEPLSHWDNPGSSSPDFIVKLLLVMSIGSIFSPARSASDTSYSTISQWIYVAQSWLNSPFEKSRINVSGTQIHCLLLLSRQANGVGGDLAWVSAGSLLKTAMHIGLHIGPSHLPNVTFYDQEIRRRLWATVLEIVVQFSMDSGGLPLIHMQGIDCELPSNIEDEQLEDANEIIDATHAKLLEEYTMTSVQIALVKSLPLRLEIA